MAAALTSPAPALHGGCCHIADTGCAREAPIVAVWERGQEMACDSHYWALEGAKKEQKGWVGGPNDQGKEGCRQGTREMRGGEPVKK